MTQIALDAGKSVEVGQNQRALELFSGGPGRTETIGIQLPCVNGITTIPLGDLGKGPLEFKLGRLDVDDVDVTMTDGTHKKVRGTYRVYDAAGQNAIVDQTFSTNTGLDLPPGKYKLHVDYPTSAGTSGHYDEDFTTP